MSKYTLLACYTTTHNTHLRCNKVFLEGEQSLSTVYKALALLHKLVTWCWTVCVFVQRYMCVSGGLAVIGVAIDQYTCETRPYAGKET